MSAAVTVPSPADTPAFTAEEFLQELRVRGARVYRMRERPMVFALTNDPKLAEWLNALGARPYLPRNAERVFANMPLGAYERTRGGSAEWDLWIHTIPVRGDEPIWDAAGRWAKDVEATEFA